MRLVALYFVIYLISALNAGFYDTAGNEKDVSFFVLAMVTIGLLNFAKEVPKLIESLLGLKLAGNFTLNPIKKINETPLIGRAATITGGVVSGGIGGAESGHALSGALFGGMSAAKTKDKGFFSGASAGYKDVTGKDYNRFSARQLYGKMNESTATGEIDDLKGKRKVYQSAQSNLDAQYDSMLAERRKAVEDKASGRISEQDFNKKIKELDNQIESNRASYGKYSGDIDTINDRIKDTKRFYNYDESNKTKMSEIDAKLVEDPNNKGTYYFKEDIQNNNVQANTTNINNNQTQVNQTANQNSRTIYNQDGSTTTTQNDGRKINTRIVNNNDQNNNNNNS